METKIQLFCFPVNKNLAGSFETLRIWAKALHGMCPSNLDEMSGNGYGREKSVRSAITDVDPIVYYGHLDEREGPVKGPSNSIWIL
jgi:hypothetical protein